MASRTEINLELAGVHLRCQGCVDAADAALMSVAGVHARCDMEKGTVALTARDQFAAQKSLNALAAAGSDRRRSREDHELVRQRVGLRK